MKYLISLLIVSQLSACATRKQPKPETVAAISGTTVSRNDLPELRTRETVKAYAVGRYSDPNFPDAMHERHTVYRREQSPDWNYLPDPPVAPPSVADSNPSPSYRAVDQANSRQRIYAEALLEQNRAMRKRIDSLQQEAGKVPELELQIDRLKKQPGETSEPAPTPARPESANEEEKDVFSAVDPELPVADEFTDPGEISLFAESDDQTQEFLLSQMRLNDEFAAELAKAEASKRASVFTAPFLRRRELAFLNHKTP